MGWKRLVVEKANELILSRLNLQLISRTDFVETWRPFLHSNSHAEAHVTTPSGPPFLKHYRGRLVRSPQKPADFAVVMPTILRPTIAEALQSVFDQRFAGDVQILIGIDRALPDAVDVESICHLVPDRHSVLVFYPGYSTSRRNGGLSYSWDGGHLRTILSYLANSRYIAYLDDDNWWGEDHLASLHKTLLDGAEWAWSRRWFVHPKSRKPICRDEWESIGPGVGFYDFLGGWVDPNCLGIDKIACEAVLRWWSIPAAANPMSADRNVFHVLRTHFRGAWTGRSTVFYQIAEQDPKHAHRLNMIGERIYREAEV